MSSLESISDSGTLKKSFAPWAFGVFLLLAGTVTIFLGREMKVSGFTDAHDPGADALPQLLAVVMIAGGAIEVVRGILERRMWAGKDEDECGSMGWSGAIVLVQVVIYTALLPMIGFALSTGAFCIALLRWLGASWKLSVAMALSLVVIVSLLFTQVFEVVLPTGRLGLPF